MRLEIVLTKIVKSGEEDITHVFDDVKSYYLVTDPDTWAHVIPLPSWYEDVMKWYPDKKVNAIKEHRSHSGLGLRESKAIVDTWFAAGRV